MFAIFAWSAAALSVILLIAFWIVDARERSRSSLRPAGAPSGSDYHGYSSSVGSTGDSGHCSDGGGCAH
jgi:hypothetical protein